MVMKPDLPFEMYRNTLRYVPTKQENWSNPRKFVPTNFKDSIVIKNQTIFLCFQFWLLENYNRHFFHLFYSYFHFIFAIFTYVFQYIFYITNLFMVVAAEYLHKHLSKFYTTTNHIKFWIFLQLIKFVPIFRYTILPNRRLYLISQSKFVKQEFE